MTDDSSTRDTMDKLDYLELLRSKPPLPEEKRAVATTWRGECQVTVVNSSMCSRSPACITPATSFDAQVFLESDRRLRSAQ